MYILLPAGTLAGESFKIDIHGYISQGFLISNKNNFLADTQKGTFQFNELGINFSADLTDKLRVGIQLAARDLGDTGNDKVKIDWAFADYRWQDWLGIRVGQIKMPIGFYNKTRDLDMLRTSILLPQSIYSEIFRDNTNAIKGISGYGEISLKALGNLSYEVLAGTMEIDKDSTTTKRSEAGRGVKVDKYDVGTMYTWSIQWETPLQGLRIGTAHEYGTVETHATLTEDIVIPVSFPPYTITAAEKGTALLMDIPNMHLSVYSFEYTWKDLVLAAEYLRLGQDVIGRTAGSEVWRRRLNVESFYGSASYRFSDWFELGVYYSVFYRDRDDRDGTKTPYNPTFYAYQKDACLSLRFDLNDDWIFKLEGHLVDGVGLTNLQDNLNDNGVPQYDRKWFLLAAKMTFSF
jgi:hypothetical protein